MESKPRSDDHPRPQREIGRPQMPAIVAAAAKVFETSEKERAGEVAASLVARPHGLGCYEGLLRRLSVNVFASTCWMHSASRRKKL